MIDVDIMRILDDEPFVSMSFEQAPAIGDRIALEYEPLGDRHHFEVTGREWVAMTHRTRPCALVLLRVREVPS